MFIKYFLLLLTVFLNYSKIALAQDLEYESPFISKTEASLLAISGVTGFMVPMAVPQLIHAQHLRNFQLQATTGVSLPIDNRRLEYLQSNSTGRRHISEQMGDTAARQYANLLDYKPIFQGNPGQGRGFDQVYRNDKQIVVIEAKGGNSTEKFFFKSDTNPKGLKQGTVEYTEQVAKETLNNKSSPAAKLAANEVIKASKENRLVIQVAKTKHVDGEAKPTIVKNTHGQINVPSTAKIAHQLSLHTGVISAGLAGGFNVIAQMAAGQSIDWQQASTMTALGGVSGYVGNFSGTLIQHSLLTSKSKLLLSLASRGTVSSLVSGVAGGVVGGLAFSYGSYLMGYSDETTVGREMVANLASYSAWAGGGALLGGAVALNFATTIAGAIGATASTGTAIASLSGAAAAKATLAVLGGGTLAAGGGGVAAGTMVLAGITATGVGILALGAGAGIMYMYRLGDEQAERDRVAYLLERVAQTSGI